MWPTNKYLFNEDPDRLDVLRISSSLWDARRKGTPHWRRRAVREEAIIATVAEKGKGCSSNSGNREAG